MPTTLFLRDVIESDLPIFFEQQLDPVANQMAVFPARDKEAFMAICHAKENSSKQANFELLPEFALC